VLRRGPLPHGFDYAGTHFAMIRLGQPAAPISAPAEASVRVPTKVYVRPGTPECRAWERYWRATTGIDMPTDKNGGWYFESRLPPGTEEKNAPQATARRPRPWPKNVDAGFNIREARRIAINIAPAGEG
jgi:hypothetical protein